MKILKNSNNTGKINGLSTSNCGEYIEVQGRTYEVMSPEYSGHGDNIVSRYKPFNSGKVEISIWKINDRFQFGIAYYKTKESLQSYRYTTKISRKWNIELVQLQKAYVEIFEKTI